MLLHDETEKSISKTSWEMNKTWRVEQQQQEEEKFPQKFYLDPLEATRPASEKCSDEVWPQKTRLNEEINFRIYEGFGGGFAAQQLKRPGTLIDERCWF